MLRTEYHELYLTLPKHVRRVIPSFHREIFIGYTSLYQYMSYEIYTLILPGKMSYTPNLG